MWQAQRNDQLRASFPGRTTHGSCRGQKPEWHILGPTGRQDGESCHPRQEGTVDWFYQVGLQNRVVSSQQKQNVRLGWLLQRPAPRQRQVEAPPTASQGRS